MPSSTLTMHAPAPAVLPSATRRALWFTLAAAFLGWMFDGMEMGIFPMIASSALGEFAAKAGLAGAQIKTYSGHWIGVITSCFLLGAATGGLVFGWLGDRIGRVRAMVLSVLAYSLFTGAIYFAQSPAQMAFCRFIAAIGMGGEWSLGVALVMEAWPQDKRPLMAGLIGAAANLGYCIIAVVAIRYVITLASWRWVTLIGAVPALLTLLIIKFVPESHKWQESVSEQGVVQNPLREMFSPGLRKNSLLAILFSSVALLVTWGSIQNIPTWVDLEVVSHAANPAAKAWSQLFSSLGAILGCMIAPFVGARFGRRPVYFGLCLGSLITCSILYRGFTVYGPGMLAMIFVVGAFAAAFYGWLPQYLPELFPTRIRATGQGVAFNSGRLLAAVGAWNLGAFLGLFEGSFAKAGAAMVFIYLVGMATIWLAPETKDRPLPA